MPFGFQYDVKENIIVIGVITVIVVTIVISIIVVVIRLMEDRPLSLWVHW